MHPYGHGRHRFSRPSAAILNLGVENPLQLGGIAVKTSQSSPFAEENSCQMAKFGFFEGPNQMSALIMNLRHVIC